MSKTIAEIALDVLQKLGRLPEGQTATAEQQKKVTDAYDGLYDELIKDSLVNWSSDDSVPEFAVYPIKILLTGMVADDFGVQDVWSARRDQMRSMLSKSLASPYVPQSTQFEDY
jgi:hypothetical protein